MGLRRITWPLATAWIVGAQGCSDTEQAFRAKGSQNDPVDGSTNGTGARSSIDAGTGAGQGIDGGVIPGGGGASNGGTAGSGGSGGSGFGGLVVGGGGFSLGGAGGVLGCSSTPFVAEGLPLDLFFLVDRSGSMDQGSNKWTNVSNALVTFANDPAYAAVDIGVGYFPLTVPGAPTFCCEDVDCGVYGPCVSPTPATLGCSHPFGNCQGIDVCQVSSYAQPAVPFALPPNHGPVVSSIQGMAPSGGTPTRPAVEGVIQYVANWGAAHPERKGVLVLATDGDPTGCSTNTPEDVANVTANALSQMGVQTFVIGVGSSLTSLNLVAQSGGTGQAYLLDVAADLTKQIADTLAAIHRAAVGCKYVLPTGAQDAGKINLGYRVNGGPRSVIPRVTTGVVADCGTNPGWYFDNPAAPEIVTLCPALCAVLSQVNTVVEFMLGCPTLISPPP